MPVRKEEAGLHLTLPTSAWHDAAASHLSRLFIELVDSSSAASPQRGRVLSLVDRLLRSALQPFEQALLDVLTLAARGECDAALAFLTTHVDNFLQHPLGHFEGVLTALQTAAGTSQLFPLKGYLIGVKASGRRLQSGDSGIKNVFQKLQQNLLDCLVEVEGEADKDSSSSTKFAQAIELVLAETKFDLIGQVVAQWSLSHRLDHPRIRDFARVFARIITPPSQFLCSAAQAADPTTQSAAYFTQIRSMLNDLWTPNVAMELLDLASTSLSPMTLSTRLMIAKDAIPADVPEIGVPPEVLDHFSAVCSLLELQMELLAVIQTEEGEKPPTSEWQVLQLEEVSSSLLSTEKFFSIAGQFKRGPPLQLKMMHYLYSRRDPFLQYVMIDDLCAIIVAALKSVADVSGVDQACKEVVVPCYGYFGAHFPLLEVIACLASLPRKVSTEELLLDCGIEAQVLFEAYLFCLDEEWVLQNTEPSLKPLNVLRCIEQILLAVPDPDHRHRCANDVKERVHILRGYVKDVRDNVGEIDRILEAVSRQDVGGGFLSRQETMSY